MLKEVQTIIEKIYDSHRRYKTWQKVVAVLGFITVFCTTYALILPAITLESSPDAICGIEEHTHTNDCYERRSVLVCENTDPDHVHTDECYRVDSVLICGKEEHKHTKACFPKEEPKEEKVIEPENPTTVASAFDEVKTTIEETIAETKLEETTATQAQTSEAETTVTEASETETTATEPSETATTEETTAAEETEETQAEEMGEEACDLPEYDSKTVIRRAGLLNPKMVKSESENPMQLKKTVSDTPNADGYYTITLEAFAKGSGSIEIHTSVAATDIILVLDQSGSMQDKMNDREKYRILRDAVNGFINTIETSALGPDKKLGTEDDVAHRVAIVGFSSHDVDNTGIFLPSKPQTAKKMTNLTTSDYQNAFYDMTNSNHREAALTASGKIGHGGKTYVNEGMEMAENIFKNNSDSTRNRLVVVFTDGVPGNANNGGWYNRSYSTADDMECSSANANDALKKAKTIKSTYKATIYTIGVFAGANASSLTDPTICKPWPTAEGKPWSEEPSSLGSESASAPYANYFMHHLSSNYNSSGSQVDTRYYMSASSASALIEAFETIAEAVQTGGSQNTELKENTTVIDAVSDYFEFPEGANESDVKVYTVDSNAVNGTEPVFDESTKKEFDAEVAFNDGKMSVKGFDYSANWCGAIKQGETYTAHSGKKIVIEVPVKPKEDFIGGYDVPTNKDNSGVYLNGEQIGTFEVPDTDVPFTGEAYGAKKTVYYGTKLTAEELYFSNEGLTNELWTKLAKYVEFIKANAAKSGDYYVIGNTEYNIELPDFIDSEEATKSTETASHAIKIQMRKKSPAGSWSGYNVSAKVYVVVPEITFKDKREVFGIRYNNACAMKYNVDKTDWVPDGVGDWTGAPAVSGTPTYDLSKLAMHFVLFKDTAVIDDNYTFKATDVAVNVDAISADGKSITNFVRFAWVDCNDNHSDGKLPKLSSHSFSDDSPEFYLHSTSGIELPSTGGSGVKNWFIVGLSLMTTPIMIGLSIKRKRSLINVF
ncbi:MAG: VWA domain-containing protein [Clostridia bacterium]|nr:VWA domain-containing protein [Clostridia bacterium]